MPQWKISMICEEFILSAKLAFNTDSLYWFGVCPAPFSIFSQRWLILDEGKWPMHITTAYNIRYVWLMDCKLWFKVFIRFKENMLIELNNLLSHVIIIRFVLKQIIFSNKCIFTMEERKSLQHDQNWLPDLCPTHKRYWRKILSENEFWNLALAFPEGIIFNPTSESSGNSKVSKQRLTLVKCGYLW